MTKTPQPRVSGQKNKLSQQEFVRRFIAESAQALADAVLLPKRGKLIDFSAKVSEVRPR